MYACEKIIIGGSDDDVLAQVESERRGSFLLLFSSSFAGSAEKRRMEALSFLSSTISHRTGGEETETIICIYSTEDDVG